jgi:dUTP pyrophosphatase
MEKIRTFSKFFVKKLVAEAVLPVKATPGSAGYDLCSIENVVIPPNSKGKIRTGLSFMIPPNTYARIAPRSGLAWKNSINVGAGVVDEDYRGEVCVILFNHGI